MDVHEKRLQDFVEADRSEYERLIKENRELSAELGDLRARHNITAYTVKDVIYWLDNESSDKQAQFQRELDEILAKHKIPEKWRVNLFYWAMTGKHVIGVAFSMGLPSVRGSIDEQGEVKKEIVIGADVDITNPIVQEDIQSWQQRVDPIPKPQPMKNNPRKLDWRPVWEWRKRHPGITHEEIAKMLGYTPDYVRHKLAELNQDK